MDQTTSSSPASVEPVQPVQPVEVVQFVEQVKEVEQDKPVEQVKEVEQVEEVKSVEQVEKFKPIESTKSEEQPDTSYSFLSKLYNVLIYLPLYIFSFFRSYGNTNNYLVTNSPTNE
jgi:hypothetical protein